LTCRLKTHFILKWSSIAKLLTAIKTKNKHYLTDFTPALPNLKRINFAGFSHEDRHDLLYFVNFINYVEMLTL